MPELNSLESSIPYELYSASGLRDYELDMVAEKMYAQMETNPELTSYPKSLVREWLATEPCVIALDNDQQSYLGAVIMKRISVKMKRVK